MMWSVFSYTYLPSLYLLWWSAHTCLSFIFNTTATVTISFCWNMYLLYKKKRKHIHCRKSPLTLPFKMILCSFYTFQIFFQFVTCMIISFIGLFLIYRGFYKCFHSVFEAIIIRSTLPTSFVCLFVWYSYLNI